MWFNAVTDRLFTIQKNTVRVKVRKPIRRSKGEMLPSNVGATIGGDIRGDIMTYEFGLAMSGKFQFDSPYYVALYAAVTCTEMIRCSPAISPPKSFSNRHLDIAGAFHCFTVLLCPRTTFGQNFHLMAKIC